MRTKPNPYNVFKIRRAQFPPDHFEYITLPLNYNLSDALISWIEENLEGRFYFGKIISLNSERKMYTSTKVGFENKKELSFFMLACPYLKYR